MSFNLDEFIKQQKLLILEEKVRLEQKHLQQCDKNENQQQKESNNLQQTTTNSSENNKENEETVNSINHVDLKCYQVDLVKNKETFIDKLSKSENPLIFRSDEKDVVKEMLRYGEYSPNNPQLRVTAAPYIGLGEYEQRRNYVLQQQKQDYLKHLAKKNNNFNCNISKEVQTDIKNIHKKLIQYDLDTLNTPEKEYSPQQVLEENNYYYKNKPINLTILPNRLDQRLTSAQNALLKPDIMDKPKSILSNRRTGSPRERSYVPPSYSGSSSFLDGFSYSDRTDDLERERLKRESYQNELRLQIEEKRRLQLMREEQERREQELENRRLEQQLLRMQEEQLIDEQRRSRRHSDDLMRRHHKHDLVGGIQNRSSSSTLDGNLYLTSHYSPPVTRRSYTNRYDTSTSSLRYDSLRKNRSMDYNYQYGGGNTLNRFDSLSRIDSLTRRMESFGIRDSMCNLHNNGRRHSATTQQHDFYQYGGSPKLQRRSNSQRFNNIVDDTLPIPVLKARSPVARELKNSIPFNSYCSTSSCNNTSSSNAYRKLEDKWQIPAVQKNIVNNDVLLSPANNKDGSRSILTQLGAIRMQLQQEQLRMDETLKKRGIIQSKAVDFH